MTAFAFLYLEFLIARPWLFVIVHWRKLPSPPVAYVYFY